jgi:phosphoribosyl-ATP pyrophosphohydrolase
MTTFTVESLEKIIAERVNASAEKSYTKSLLEAGVPRIAKKFGEEAVEAVIASMQSDRPAFVGEAADVVYHLLVLLRAREVSFSEVLKTLEARTAKSGHEEKASRGQPG